ncbi:MAG: 50S ribosomal protein L11 methyltransferase [Bacteriovoracaceae bacterium]
MNSYFNIRISFDKNQISICEEIERSAMNEYECDGIHEFSLNEEEVDSILGEKVVGAGNLSEEDISLLEDSILTSGTITKDFFFYGDRDQERAEYFFAFLNSDYSELSILLEQKDGEDWNDSWRENFQPIIVSDNIKIYPSWMKEESKSDPSVIYIYPGQGFGTGDHETTFLCLKLLDEINSQALNSGSCLDLGCGSGILGIAAIKKGLKKVHFCDVDVCALENTRQNLKHNKISEDDDEILSFLRDDFYLNNKYDLVFANIIQNILLMECNLITDSTVSGGYLILSGLIKGQEKEVLEKYSAFEQIKLITKGEWLAILLRKL